MNKFEKALVAIAVSGTVGFAFAFAALRGIPEALDWQLDEEESYE
jgi:hypothetical protein